MAEYSDNNSRFLEKNKIEFSKHFKINKHAIKLETSKQLSFRPIYSRKLVKLETLNIYIEINLTNGFI